MTVHEEIQEIDVFIQRGLFDRKQRQLLINPDFIQFDDKISSDIFTKFDKNEICGYRYGVKFISGYQFTIGREFLIFIHNSSNQTLKINFKSFYNFKKQEYYNLFNTILNTMWKCYFGNVVDEFVSEFYKGQDIVIGRAIISSEAIIINEPGVIKNDKKVIPWDDLETKDYHTYFAVYSSKDASKTNATFSYLNDWNTGVLYSVVRTILHKKKTQSL